MEQLIEFAGNHLMLVIALFVISGALAWNLLSGGGKNNIPPHEATTLINRKDAVIVDVRPIADFNKGHIVDARNIQPSRLAKPDAEIEKPKDRKLLLVCRSMERAKPETQQPQAPNNPKKGGFGFGGS